MSLFGTKPTDVNQHRSWSEPCGGSRNRRHSFPAGCSDGGRSRGSRRRHPFTKGDVAILRFLAAAEILETDLWQQYNELAGVDAAGSGYLAALSVLDEDINQDATTSTTRSATRRF